MNVKEYLESGLLELYVVNQLNGSEKLAVEEAIARYPELKEAVNRIEELLEDHARVRAIPPPARLKSKIMDTIANLDREQKMDLEQLPLINRFSDSAKWLAALKPLIPAQMKTPQFEQVLQQKDSLLQLLVVSAVDFEDEQHDDLHESFLILRGTCKCTVGNKTIFMRAGDFMEIPLQEMHRVEVVSGYVTAVVQRIAVTA